MVLGETLQLAGAVQAILWIGAPNRSGALALACRALKSSGAYRWVQLHSAYTLGNVWCLMSHASWRIAILIATSIGYALIRIHAEERFLGRYPEYVQYERRTRWRLIPFIS